MASAARGCSYLAVARAPHGGESTTDEMEQQITYASLGDRRIASAAIGAGRALVLPAWWVSDLADDWRREGFRDFVNLLAARRRVIRYDRVGTGCSDRQRPPETLTLAWEVGTRGAGGLTAGLRVRIWCGR